MASASRWLARLAVSVACFGCQREKTSESEYPIDVRVRSSPEEPVQNAEILSEASVLARTDAEGRARLRLRGGEGDSVRLQVRCPAGYSSTAPSFQVSLRRVEAGSKRPSYQAECAPETRSVVVAVRATNGADLPVVYLGKELARTDASGVAHVELRLHPGERFELMLDTHEKPQLSPQNPSAVLVAKGDDEVLVVDQTFKLPAAPRTQRRRSGPQAF